MGSKSGEVIGGWSARVDEARRAEIAGKREKLQAFLETHSLAGILLQRHENVAWATAGLVESRIAIPAETGAASLLVTRAGEWFYLAPNNEAARLADEEFNQLEATPVIYEWHENALRTQVERLSGLGMSSGPVAADHAGAGFAVQDVASLRAVLTDAEIERYRWLGRQTADVIEEELKKLEPRVTEFEMEARVAAGLLERGILPSVLLMAVDDRIRKYRHAVARGAVLEKFGMLNLCSRKWGLCVSITRFVHFGEPEQELMDGFGAVAEVNGRLLGATRAGATSAELFAVAKNAFEEQGYPGEEEKHHQGGATGYSEREWVATPTAGHQVTVQDRQAFAWNPSVAGAKAEDTVILKNGEIETLTETAGLPAIVAAGYKSAGLLVR